MPVLPYDIIHSVLGHIAHPLDLDQDFHDLVWGEHGAERYERNTSRRLYTPAELDSKFSLAACALVSREWATMVQPFQFQIVSLRFSALSKPRRLEDINAWLQDARSVGKYIRKLSLCMKDEAQYEALSPLHNNYCNLTTLAALLDRCPALEALAFFDVSIKYERQAANVSYDRPRPLASPLNLRHFYWSQKGCITSDSPAGMIFVLSWLGDVDKLCLRDARLDDFITPGRLPQMTTVTTRPRSLHVNPVGSRPILDALLGTSVFHSLTRLHLLFTASRPIPNTLFPTLAVLTPCVVELFIHIDYTLPLIVGYPEFVHIRRNLPASLRLEKLCLVLPGWYGPEEGQWAIEDEELLWKYHAEMICDLAQSPVTSSTRLEFFEIAMFGELVSADLSESFAPLAHCFARVDQAVARTSVLKKLVFSASTWGTEPENAQKAVADAMPLLHGQGRLGFRPKLPY